MSDLIRLCYLRANQYNDHGPMAYKVFQQCHFHSDSDGRFDSEDFYEVGGNK